MLRPNKFAPRDRPVARARGLFLAIRVPLREDALFCPAGLHDTLHDRIETTRAKLVDAGPPGMPYGLRENDQ